MSIFLKHIESLEAFKKFIPGQFHSWADYKILLANRIAPATGADFDSLYRMIHLKRFDYLPRSVLEIDQEMETLVKLHNIDAVVDPHTLLIYPTAMYFYVNSNNQALADTLQTGLETIIANGIFDLVFYQHYGDIIDKIRSEKRQVFRLDNPFLPPSVPINRVELWLE